MNRYRKLTFVLTVLFVLAVLLVGCKENAVESMNESTETVETLPTTEATQETYPKGEGVGFVTNDEEPMDPDDADVVISPSDPTEDTKPNDNENVVETTKPNDNTETTEPNEGQESDEETKPEEGFCCEYARYLAMSPADQEAYMNTFKSPLDFIEWCKTADAEHKEHDDSTNVEGGDVDIGDYMDPTKSEE